MLALIKRVLFIGFAASMATMAAMIAVIGGLFLWRLVSHERGEATFEAPNRPWSVRIEESCPKVGCYKHPYVVVRNGWFSISELQCDMQQTHTDRGLFNKIHSVSWQADDTILDWTAGDPPVTGRLHLREDCYITAVVDDRPRSVSLRFKENCLIGACWRSLDWIEGRGSYAYTTPCRITATGEAPVFTRPDDPLGQVSVIFDLANKRAKWSSSGTGQTGVIDFTQDCDAARQKRHDLPA